MPFKQASSLVTQHSLQGNINPCTRCLLHNRTARPPARNCLGQYNRGRTPSLLATSSGTSNSLLIRHKNLRRTKITRLYARLYAAGPMLQLLLPGVWPRWRTSSCCCCCCCCSSSCRRAAAGGRAAGGGWAGGAWGGDFGCGSLSHVLISHLKTKLPTI